MVGGQLTYLFSQHANEEIKRRGIPLDLVESVMKSPQQIVGEYGNKKAYQSKIDFDGKIYLLRVIVNDSVEPMKIVTVSLLSQ